MTIQVSSLEVIYCCFDNRVFHLIFYHFTAESHLALFTAAFETNPLDGKCDQRAEVSSQPLKIIYDAVSTSSLQIITYPEMYVSDMYSGYDWQASPLQKCHQKMTILLI